MVFSSPPSWLPQTEFDEFNDITYDKIKSYTNIPKLNRLERYMREEGFAKTAEVARQRIIAQGSKDSHCPEPCLSSSEDEVALQSIQYWQENITEEKLKEEPVTKGLSKESLGDSIAQKDERIKSRLEAKPLVEREWLARREREKGNDLFKAKEFNASLKAYTEGISMNKDNASLYANRAAVYLQMNRFEEAYADCTEALKLDPQNLKEVLTAVPEDKSVVSEIKTMMMDSSNGRLLLPKREGPMIIEEIHEEIPHLPISKKISKQNSSQLQPFENIGGGVEYVHTQKCFIENSADHGQTPCENQNLLESSLIIQKGNGDATQMQSQDRFAIGNLSYMQNDSRNQDHLQTKFCSSDVRRGSSTALQTSNVESPEKQRKAVQERLRGNEYFKSGQYVDAIYCDNESLKLDRMVAATHTNLALCHLRLKEPAKAIYDCTQAILLEPSNSKAFYRRAASKQQIQDNIGALEDFKMFVSLCPGVGSVEALIKELESKLHGKTPVNEVKEPVSVHCDACSDSVKAKKCSPTKKVSEILQNLNKWRTPSTPDTPKSALEFERSCLDLLKQPLALKAYICAIPIKLYPMIFKDDFSARLLKLVAVFLKENTTLFEPKEMCDILQGFTRVKRFGIVVLVLEPCAKEAVKQVLELLAAAMDVSVDVNYLTYKYLCSLPLPPLIC